MKNAKKEGRLLFFSTLSLLFSVFLVMSATKTNVDGCKILAFLNFISTIILHLLL